MSNISRLLINSISFLLLVLILGACADNVEKASRLPPKEPALSIVTILPESGQLDAEPDGVFIAVNKSIDIESLANAIVVTDANGNSVEGSTDFDPKTNNITFIPTLGRFNLRNAYTVNVADGIKNTAGELLPAIEPWSFTVRDGVWGKFRQVEGTSGVFSISQFFLNNSGKITLLWVGVTQEAGQPTVYFTVKDFDPVTRSWESYAQKINIDLVDMRFGSKNAGSNMNSIALPIVVNDSENITLVGLGKNDLEIRAIRYIGKDQKWENASVNLGSFSIDTYNSGLPNYFESLRVDNVGLGFIHVNWTEIATYGAVSIKSQYFNRISWWSDAKPLLDGGLDVGYGKSAMSPLGDFVAVWTQPNDNTGDPILAARSYSSYSGTIYPKLVDPPYAVATTPIYGYKTYNVTMDANGSAYVYWVYEDPSNENQIYARIYESQDLTQPKSWKNEALISLPYPNSTIYDLKITFDGDNNAIATWVVFGSNIGFLYSNAYVQSTKAWSKVPTLIHKPDASVTDSGFQKNQNDELVYYWVKNDSDIWSRTFRNGAWTDSTNANDIDLTTTGIFTVEDATGSKIEIETTGGTIVSRLFE